MVTYIRSDLEFILDQIKIAEAHANGQPLFGEGGLVPTYNSSLGLRTVDGTFNNLLPGQEEWGASDNPFPEQLPLNFRPASEVIDLNGPAPGGMTAADYTPSNNPGNIVVDSTLRTISNLIVDQSLGNPAAVFKALQTGGVVPADLANVQAVLAIHNAFQPFLIDAYRSGVAVTNALTAMTEARAAHFADPSDPLKLAAWNDAISAHEAAVEAAAIDAAALVDARAVRDAAIQPFGVAMDGDNVSILNVSPDGGLSAPFNSMFTLFGQFFDHGLDLVDKGGSGVVYIPLQPDDPLYVPGSDTNFMVLTRASVQPGADGIMGTADDIRPINRTTSFVDQNQTYTSHASHQVFLRQYVTNSEGRPVATGHLIEGGGAQPGGMATWGEVKAQALLLGIELTDNDVGNVPLLRTDPYGNFIPDAFGYAQVIVGLGVDGIPNTADDVVVSQGNTGIPVNPTTAFAIRTGHAFLADIAHHAAPGTVDHDHNPATPKIAQVADSDMLDYTGDGISDANDVAALGSLLTDANGDSVIDVADLADVNLDGTINFADLVADDHNPLTYDNELLDAHFIGGDGRVNENIGLTAVHSVFHSEHNRLAELTKSVVLADAAEMLANGSTQAEAVAFLNEWLSTDVTEVPAGTAEINALVWDGNRLFQAAKFGTEMQYQHLVFEDFARKIQPNIDFFIVPDGYHADINPSIVAEFAHVVYRFGHSMLNEQVDRLDSSHNNDQIGLIEAFLNPIAFDANHTIPDNIAAGDIIRGMTRQVGNEIDEFVTSALQNNLLGLPLDLATINLARGRDTGVPSLNEVRREFYEASQQAPELKPYESWSDFAANLKNEASIINFIAAYGTHDAITAQSTIAGKRAVAMAMIFNQDMTFVDGNGNTVTIVAADITDAADFLNSEGAWANNANGSTITGLDLVDLWIGGLAEKLLPFGGMLGSTFNYVFEIQMEMLQDGDRFYYLQRLDGLHLLAEMENNTFAKLIANNADVGHLPSDVFSTPGLILEVDRTKQYNPGLGETAGADGILNDDPNTAVDESADNLGNDPVGGTLLTPLVIRNNPATPGPDTNYLRYTGTDHVMLGGTDGNDILISSEGDDTLHGDAGNDRMHGGAGNDSYIGGAGDDIITDIGGDDIIRSGAGNDAVNAGVGTDLIIADAGHDFVVLGPDLLDETFLGLGNDYVLGSKTTEMSLGGEGNDWIEIGAWTGAVGDNFDDLARDAVTGHDVFRGDGGFDEFIGEGGDDIWIGTLGRGKFDGMSGFDWATYKDYTFGVNADLTRLPLDSQPLPPPNAALDTYTFVEGVSGTAFNDQILGSNVTAADMATQGARGSVLTAEGIALINGLQATVGEGVTSFSGGNILLGGDGSDTITGRGGDDIIDGDAWLNVRVGVFESIGVDGGVGAEIDSANSIKDLVTEIFNGTYNPGQLRIVREILTANGVGDIDTARFSDVRANYTITYNVDGSLSVSHTGGTGADGTDTLRNIEVLDFADVDIAVPMLIVDSNANANAVNENAAVGTAVGITASAGAATFSLTSNPGGLFAINSTTGVVTVAAGVDREAVGPNVVITVTADFGGGNTSSQNFAINVNDVDEFDASIPVDTNAALDIVAEGAAVGTAFGFTAFATDADATNNTITYSLTNNAGGLFTIDAATGVVTVAGAIDREAVGASVNITVQAASSDGSTSSQTFAIAIADVDEFDISAVSDADAASNVVAENAALGTVVGVTAFASDADATNNTITYSLTDNAGGLFTIDASTGVVTVAGAIDRETVGASLNITVQATSSDGSTSSQTFAIAISDIDEFDVTPIADIDATADAVTENAAVGTVVGITASASDADVTNNTITYSLTDSAGGLFAIDATTGVVTVAGVINRETSGAALNITVQAESSDGSTSSQTYAISVADVDEFDITPILDTDSAANTVQENSVVGTVVGLVAFASDADATNNTVNYSLTNNAGGRFAIDAATGLVTVAGALDFETATSHVIQVMATSADGSSAVQSYTINVSDLSPVINDPVGDADGIVNGTAENDTVNGLGGNDILDGGLGNDNVNGGAGNDRILFTGNGAGYDNIDGGADTDTVDVSGMTQGAWINLDYNGDEVWTRDGTVWRRMANMTGVENVTGSNFADQIYGDALSNRLEGNGGNDLMYGRAGADTMIGGGGNDSMYGEVGNDMLYADGGTDFLSGGADNDTFFFSTAVGNGLDTADGGGGTDTINTSNFTAMAWVDLATAGWEVYTTINGGANWLGLANTTGMENVIGSNQHDQLFGNGQANQLEGGLGNDLLVGRGGQDTLIGGAGSDTFRFAAGDSGTPTTSFDIISDFAVGAFGVGDKIDFAAGLTVGGTAGVATAGQASINAANGVATFDAGSGSTLADAVADISAAFDAGGNTAGDFAFFNVNGTGPTYMLISDGVVGINANDVLVRLDGVSTVNSINITGGDVTILT